MFLFPSCPNHLPCYLKTSSGGFSTWWRNQILHHMGQHQGKGTSPFASSLTKPLWIVTITYKLTRLESRNVMFERMTDLLNDRRQATQIYRSFGTGRLSAIFIQTSNVPLKLHFTLGIGLPGQQHFKTKT